MIAFQRVVTDATGSYVWDSSRGKLLSISRKSISSGRYSHYVSNEYLRFDDGIPGSSSGKVVKQNATITSLSGMTSVSSPWTIKIFKYGSLIPIFTQAVSTQSFIFNGLNIDVNAGDVLQLFANGINIRMPIVELELAWRL
jgi:hypothetical protein